MIALIAAGVLLVLAGLGYLLFHPVNSAVQREEQTYDKWVSGFAAGLGDRPAVVILEPDALAELSSCSGNAQRQARLQMLSYAVQTLQSKTHHVYLDAGHSDWVPPGQMAIRLKAADVAQAYGFSLNVSNYQPTGQQIGYAHELDRDLGMAKRFVVDTSRNGEDSAGGLSQGAGSKSRSAGGLSHPVGGSLSRALPAAGRGALANRLFTDPDTQAADWVRAHPGDPLAHEIGERIADQPTAQWFGPWNTDITAAVSSYTAVASREHKVPVLVTYAIPRRYCGGNNNMSDSGEWCNVPGQLLGSAPRVLDSRGDMALWIKPPGESDGNCGVGAGTRAGEFSPAIAKDLMAARS
ncbi:MAG TPA: glycoside hydrolase family 6 protein [Streptosporangiaceae bacterium]|nr:glycoside hydrolase family 6 protein [Streptosporangiaceae bacterium]